MNISFACTDEDWRRSTQAVWERTPAFQRIMHFERFVFTCVPLIVGGSSRESLGVFLGAAVALVVYFAYPHWLKRVIGGRALRQLKNARGTSDWGKVEYSINGRGMLYRDVTGEVTTLWWACKGASVHHGDVYVDTVRMAYRVPRRAFASEAQLQDFLAFVNDHSGFSGAAVELDTVE